MTGKQEPKVAFFAKIQKSRIYGLATGLLIVMALLYVLARYLEPTHAAWSWVRAFTEAGMVGALADWFAVVALFRHPLGCSWIPHTAIIAKRKDKIADNLASFVQEHFLGPEQIMARLDRMQITSRLSEWLAQRDKAEIVSGHIADALPRILNALDDSHMRRFIRESVESLVGKVPVAPLAGRMIDILMERGWYVDFFENGLRFGKHMLDENVDLIANRLAMEMAKVPDFLGLKRILIQTAAKKIVSNLQNGIDEILRNKKHPLRSRFFLKVSEAGRKLRESPEWYESAENLKRTILNHPTLIGSLDSLWGEAKVALEENLKSSKSSIRNRITEVLQETGLRLQKDKQFQTKLERWIHDGLNYLIQNHGGELGNLIRDTMNRWDGAELSEKLEAQVGPDLQYIRINGTLVGGLVGIALHALGLLLW